MELLAEVRRGLQRKAVDGDGIADACDVCPDGVLDGCGVCGGNHSSCGIFLDGFESGTASAWR